MIWAVLGWLVGLGQLKQLFTKTEGDTILTNSNHFQLRCETVKKLHDPLKGGCHQKITLSYKGGELTHQQHMKNIKDKQGLSCAKLSPAKASYILAIGQLPTLDCGQLMTRGQTLFDIRLDLAWQIELGLELSLAKTGT